MAEKFKLSQRLTQLPPYLFAEIDRQKNILRKKGKEIIDISIGDPDILAPRPMANLLAKYSRLKENQRYALDQGKLSLREAIKRWMYWRFKVNLNPEKNILPLLGSKEGLVHFPLAFVNPGEYIMVPIPGYPGYRGGAIFSQAKIYELVLEEKNNFLPVLEKIPLRVRNKAKLIYLNYPNNPTTAVVDKKDLEPIIKFCSHYGIILVYDNAYSEIYFDQKPCSIFEVKGAQEVAVEFHSFSKTFCMTGVRLGWACGNEKFINGLLKVKTNIDSGIFGAIQEMGAYLLDNERDYVKKLRETIRSRRDFFLEEILKKINVTAYAQSTFYIWMKIPNNFDSRKYASLLLNKGIVATPGIGFGRNSDNFIRFALTVGKKDLKRAIELL